jgi:DNA-binding MarR family transcriptional regulator
MSDKRIDPLSRLLERGAQPAPSDQSAGASADDERHGSLHPAAYAGAVRAAPVAERLTADLFSPLAADGSHDVDDEEVDVATTDDMNANTGAEVASGTGPGTAADSMTSAIVVDTLDELAPIIDRARTFAERWDAPYRSEIFQVALGQLLGGAPKSAALGAPHSPTSAARGPIPEAWTVASDSVPRGGPALGPTEKLARQLSVDPDAVERAVQFEQGGKISIIGRIEGKTRRELQIKYGLALLYVKEIALATRLVEIDDLRAVCVEHGCYDQNNFTGNFKKAVQDGVLREQPTEKGARVRRYMLTQKGMNEAAAILREMVLQ